MDHRGYSALNVDDHLSVRDLYPGFLDPETLVARIVRALEKGRLQGRPFTSVVIDGIHNMLVQFPLLQHEPLLWPTLYRLFRSHNVDAVSTFTFFRIATSGGDPLDMVSEEAKVFAHLLVCNCDYSFIVVRSESGPLLAVTEASSLDPLDPRLERLVGPSVICVRQAAEAPKARNERQPQPGGTPIDQRRKVLGRARIIRRPLLTIVQRGMRTAVDAERVAVVSVASFRVAGHPSPISPG